MAKYAHLNMNSRANQPWTCVPCAVSLPSAEEFEKHCSEVDVAAHRFCAPCNIVFPTLARFHEHYADEHDVEVLVSPEAQKIKKEVAKERREANMTEDDKARQKAAEEQRKLQRQLEKAERKQKEMEQMKKELESKGPVVCVVCSKKFTTPGDYAQHLESGTHSAVKRHHVTQAVHMLDVAPPITLEPSLPYLAGLQDGAGGRTTSTITEYGSVPPSPTTPFTSIPSSPTGSEASSLAGPMVLASSMSTAVFSTDGSHLVSPTGSPFDPAIAYTPNDFAHLGIPYACALCFKTFRNVVQLTAHMNSPVHDPDAFKCPGPKCGRQFALVSGLIQHLESGSCKLASAGEIFERFALLTARFSKYLAV